MSARIEKIKAWLQYEFGLRPEQMYPARDKHQVKYRAEFGDIVDKYLIYYDSDRDSAHPDAFHRIVFIDVDNDIDWIEEGDPKLSEEQLANRGKYIAKLDVANALPAQNLSQAEIFTFKKILGGGYSAALGGDFEAVENAIQEAQKYRDDRNKERSRLMLIAGAVVITIIIGLLYAWYYLTTEHPHFNMLTCMLMGAVGACVSTWLNNRKFDFTGQGLPILHYLEATMRIMMGVVFAFIVYMGMKSGMILTVFVPHASVYMYCILGFLAGFCETFVPSLLESFVNISKE